MNNEKEKYNKEYSKLLIKAQAALDSTTGIITMLQAHHVIVVKRFSAAYTFYQKHGSRLAEKNGALKALAEEVIKQNGIIKPMSTNKYITKLNNIMKKKAKKTSKSL